MTQAGLITRLMQAAEEWTRKRYGREVVVVSHGDAERYADGRIQAVVELDTLKTGERPRRVRCIATLEPDGTVSCLGEGKGVQD
jgi:hypothetical protein